MPLPDTVRVKLSSEAAGAVTITPVVVRELAVRELIEEIAAVCGKDVTRAAEILRRGSFTSGATRFRWEPLLLTSAEVEAAITFLPEADPSRPFAPERCDEVLLRGGGRTVSIDRVTASARRLFQRTSFWDALLTAAGAVEYGSYNYRARADIYRANLTADARQRIREALPLLHNATLERQLRSMVLESVEFMVLR